MFAIFALNTLMPWRTVALVCSAVPVITAISVYFVGSESINNKQLSNCSINGLFLFFFFVDSRNATMAAIQKPNGRSPKIIAMASRLGTKARYRIRISRFATSKHTLKFMPIVCQTKHSMYTSIANDAWKIPWIETQTNIETIRNRHGLICAGTIFRCICDASIYHANFPSIQ